MAMIASVVAVQAAAAPLGTPDARLPAAHLAAGLPSDRLHFGLANAPGNSSWMQTSGVPWKYRYQYLSGGVNTGAGWETWNSPPGQFATFYMSDSDSIGAIPVFTYYELLQSLPSTGGTELDRDYSNLNNTSTMKAYYTNFALLMTMAKAFGKPVVVHVEPDLFADMEQKAAGGNASAVSASVASSSYTGLGALPNTFQGFTWALLTLRNAIAPNVILATHASAWASGVDIGLNTDPTLNLAANADTVAAFLNSAGIAANPTGTTFDVVFNDVADRDSGTPSGHWWDRNDTNLPDFKQWLTWITELHAKTARQMVVWQVPVGNQYFDTMNQTPGHYQDNRAEYFLSHVSALQAAGIVAVLFGSGGNDNSTTYTNAKGDGVTNPSPVSTFECNLCNNHTSVWSDDDGGYLRVFVGQYYATASTNPTVSSLAPSSGPAAGGTSVLITGTNLSGASAVKFGTVAASTYTVDSATQITATSPAGSGEVDVRVTSAGGTSSTSSKDLFSYVQPPGPYHALSPARVLDTRTSVGGHLGKLGLNGTMAIQITGRGGVPSTGVSAVVMNVTVTNTTAGSFLTIYPDGVLRPLASNLNWVAGQTVPNLVEVGVGADGKVAAYNAAGSTDVIFDVAGYVSTAATGTDGLYNPVVPDRVLDTRNGNGGYNTPVGPGQTINLQVGGRLGSGVPATGVSAVVLNVTATAGTAPSYLIVYPMGTTRPLASNLNFRQGQTVANRVIVKVGTNAQTASSGWVSIYNSSGSVNVVADVGGWFTDGTDLGATGADFGTMTPTRLMDTRNGHGPIGPGATLVLPIAGLNGVPSNATAVVLNVTVTGPTAASFMTVWPAGASQPLTSDLNYLASQTVPGLVVVKLGSGGAVDFFNATGSTNVVVDIVGWYGG